MTLTSAQKTAADALDAAAAAIRALADEPAADAPGVVRKMTNHSLKSGNLVEIVEAQWSPDAVGKVGELRVENDGSFGVILIGIDGGYTAVDAVKLAADAIKVGDRVRVTDVAPWTEYFSQETSKGKLATVTAVGTPFRNGVTKGFTVRVDGKNSTNRVGKVEKLSAPAVGDRVTVTEVALGFMPERTGWTGKITHIRADGKYTVTFDGHTVRGCTVVATKVTPLADDAPSVPAPTVLIKPVVPEPENEFTIYDGDSLKFEYEGRGYGNAVNVQINNGVTVYVSDGEVDDLIAYLQTVKAHRAS